MSRRIREAIVGVSAAIVLVLGLPLAVVVHRMIVDSEVVALQSSATRTLAEIAVPLDVEQLRAIGGESDAPPPFAVYDAAGRRIFGPGPARADALVRQALRGNPATSEHDVLEVAVPVTDRSKDERIVGAVRVTESLRRADRRVHVAWLLMAGSAAAALGGAWLVGSRLARRLSQPLTDLAAEAARIGDGGSLARQPDTGIDEIDALAAAMAAGTDRVNEALARERQFSEDVSHQLRTPITALHLELERADGAVEPSTLQPILGRLEDTVDHLLSVARDAMPASADARLDVVVHEAALRWAARAEAADRRLDASVSPGDPVVGRGSEASIAQILDVLIDNALRHGRGTVAVGTRRLTGGVAVDVRDEGSVALADVDRIFERGHGEGHGIGLALARWMAEREGGRLVASHVRPTTFSLILVHPPESPPDPDPDPD